MIFLWLLAALIIGFAGGSLLYLLFSGNLSAFWRELPKPGKAAPVLASRTVYQEMEAARAAMPADMRHWFDVQAMRIGFEVPDFSVQPIPHRPVHGAVITPFHTPDGLLHLNGITYRKMEHPVTREAYLEEVCVDAVPLSGVVS